MLTLQAAIMKFFGLQCLSTFSNDLLGILNPIRHGVGLLWTRDQLVGKASTGTEQHKINTKTNIHDDRELIQIVVNYLRSTRTWRFIAATFPYPEPVESNPPPSQPISVISTLIPSFHLWHGLLSQWSPKRGARTLGVRAMLHGVREGNKPHRPSADVYLY
jgi:hypothetical protein